MFPRSILSGMIAFWVVAGLGVARYYIYRTTCISIIHFSLLKRVSSIYYNSDVCIKLTLDVERLIVMNRECYHQMT